MPCLWHWLLKETHRQFIFLDYFSLFVWFLMCLILFFILAFSRNWEEVWRFDFISIKYWRFYRWLSIWPTHQGAALADFSLLIMFSLINWLRWQISPRISPKRVLVCILTCSGPLSSHAVFKQVIVCVLFGFPFLPLGTFVLLQATLSSRSSISSLLMCPYNFEHFSNLWPN